MLSRTLRRTALLLSLGSPLIGCQSDLATARTGLAGAVSDGLLAGPSAGETAEDGKRHGKRRGKKKKRWSESPVYVDGAFQGMLKYAELPPTLPTLYKTFAHDEDKVARRFAWTDYFTAAGLDVDRIRAVHFYGGRDIVCVVEGKELRRVGKDFQFSFTRATSGFPRLEIPADGIEYNSYVDKLRGVAVYIDETPPTYDTYDGLRMPDGSEVTEGYPYAERKQPSGTRVYLDGALVEVVHRRALDPEAKRDTGYDLSAALSGFGVDLESVEQIQLVGRRDKVKADIDRASLAKWSFEVPRGSRGRIEMADEGPIDAVLLYSRATPADRSLPTMDSGSQTTHVGGEKLNNSEERLAARSVQRDPSREVID